MRQITEQDVAAGRFAPLRDFDKTPCMPCWLDFAPRFGVAYDLFGNAKTALKGSFNKYMAGQTLELRAALQPAAAPVATTPRPGATRNGDNIAQETEIGPPATLRFGLPVFRPAARGRSGRASTTGVTTSASSMS